MDCGFHQAKGELIAALDGDGDAELGAGEGVDYAAGDGHRGVVANGVDFVGAAATEEEGQGNN